MNDKYKIILENFVSDFQNKHEKPITTQILEEKVINLSCLFILSKNNIDSNAISSNFHKVLQDSNNVISENFAEAALNLYPTLYGEREFTSALFGISQNITWEGMWLHLRKYFINKYDLDITSKEFWNK